MTALEIQVDAYLAEIEARVGNGLSPRTLDQYAFSLRKVFLPFCRRQKITDVKAYTQAVDDRLTRELTDPQRNLAAPSVRAYRKGFAGFLAWAQAPVKMRFEKPEKIVADALTRDQITAMENAAVAERDRVLIRLMANTGARLSETVGLTVADIQSLDGQTYLRFNGKGRKQRLTGIDSQLRDRLGRLVAGRAPTDKVFVSIRSPYRPLTKQGAFQAVKGAARLAKIPDVHPHRLRHSFITWMVQEGWNPVELANMVGHSGVELIMRVYYAHDQKKTGGKLAALIEAERKR